MSKRINKNIINPKSREKGLDRRLNVGFEANQKIGKQKNTNENADSFFDKYPTMRSIIREETIKINKNDQNLYRYDSRSWVTLSVYLILILFTILLLSLRTNIEQNYHNKDSIYNVFSYTFTDIFSIKMFITI